MEDFSEYGTKPEALDAIKTTMSSWADEIQAGPIAGSLNEKKL